MNTWMEIYPMLVGVYSRSPVNQAPQSPKALASQVKAEQADDYR